MYNNYSQYVTLKGERAVTKAKAEKKETEERLTKDKQELVEVVVKDHKNISKEEAKVHIEDKIEKEQEKLEKATQTWAEKNPNRANLRASNRWVSHASDRCNIL